MVIFEEATFDTFGYEVRNLSPKSTKFVIAVCNDCAKVRTVRRYAYHELCSSCSHKGNTSGHGNEGKTLTKETKALISAANKGKTFTEEHKKNISAAHKGEKNHMFGKIGIKHHNYKGGKKEKYKRYRKTAKGKINNAKVHAKRRQCLGYTLLVPLAEGEVGHHFTDEYVIGIPRKVHETLCGYSRKKHRALILKWLKENDPKKYNLITDFLR
jgi:hypothetical protein